MKTIRLLSAADAARVLDLTPAAIRAMARRGALPVAAMTEGGMHLFRRADVEALARNRAKRQRSRERRGEGR
jgi:DNA-binding transcriptional MerR regulator